mgnify:CR=1 FL=1
MPTSHKLTFKNDIGTQPPLLEKIIRQYQALHTIEGSYTIQTGWKIHKYDGDKFSTSTNRKQINGCFELRPKFYSDKLTSIRGSGYFFAYEMDEIDDDDDDDDNKTVKLITTKVKFTPRQNRAGLIYEFKVKIAPDEVDFIYKNITIVPRYDSNTGRIRQLEINNDCKNIFPLTNNKGIPLNVLLLNSAKPIYKSTAELLSDLVK